MGKVTVYKATFAGGVTVNGTVPYECRGELARIFQATKPEYSSMQTKEIKEVEKIISEETEDTFKTFKYRAIDQFGRNATGKHMGRTREEVLMYLKENGLFPVDVSECCGQGCCVTSATYSDIGEDIKEASEATLKEDADFLTTLPPGLQQLVVSTALEIYKGGDHDSPVYDAACHTLIALLTVGRPVTLEKPGYSTEQDSIPC